MTAFQDSDMTSAIPAITDTADYKRIANAGQKWFCPAFVIQVAPKDKSIPAACGLTVSRRVGGAVERNRAKRRLREIVRGFYLQRQPAGFDYVLIARDAALSRDFVQMQKDLVWGLGKLGVL